MGEVLHRKKTFNGETAEEVFQKGFPLGVKCHACAGGHPIEYAILWLSYKEVEHRRPDMIAGVPFPVLQTKLIRFDFGSGPEIFIHWTTFYLCSGCRSTGERQLAGMMREKKIDALGFLEWHRGPGKTRAQSSVPDDLVGSGVRGPGGGQITHGVRAVQRSAIVDPKTGRGYEVQ